MDQKVLFEIKKFSGGAVFFTDRKKTPNFAQIIQELPKNSTIIIREYDLNRESRKEFAQKIISLAKNSSKNLNLKIIIGKDIALAKELKADGVHFSDLDNIELKLRQKRSFASNFIFSISCHNLRSVIRLQKLKPNIIFISPIFPTTSHIGAKNIGLRELAKISFKTKKQEYSSSNIYALGGINLTNIRSIRKLRITGFGAIDLFIKTSKS